MTSDVSQEHWDSIFGNNKVCTWVELPCTCVELGFIYFKTSCGLVYKQVTDDYTKCPNCNKPIKVKSS